MKICSSIKASLKRLPEIFLDDSGKVSMAKLMIVCIVIMMFEIVNVYLFFAVTEFFDTKKIPQWPVAVAGLITALGGVVGILYGANKFSPTIPFIKNDSGHFQLNICERIVLAIVYFLYWFAELSQKAYGFLKNKITGGRR